jgi:hypothetical protein
MQPLLVSGFLIGGLGVIAWGTATTPTGIRLFSYSAC